MSVFNCARYLNEAIESVLKQDEVDFEFIIVNDGSTDDSMDILYQYAAQDDRIRLIDQQNVGLTRALIYGCNIARGKYIARQDSDDISLPNRFDLQSKMLQKNHRLAFVSSWSDVIGPEGELLRTYKRPAGEHQATRQLMDARIGPPGHGSVMFRRDCYQAVGGYRSEFYFAQDSDLWLRLGAMGQLAYVQKILYRYRVSNESISGAKHYTKLAYAEAIDELYKARKKGEEEAPILEKVRQFQKNKPENTRSSEGITLYFIGRNLFARHDSRAFKYFSRSVQLDRRLIKAWVFLLLSLPLLFKKIK